MLRPKRLSRISGWFGGLLLSSIGFSSVQADILVSNLDRPFRASTPIANPEYWAGQSFLFATPNPVQLTSIDAIVGNGAGSPAVVAELRGSVAGEIDNSAGGLLATFTSPDLSGATSIRNFTPGSAVTLLPNTLYWFTLGSSNAGTFDWDYANDPLTSGFGILSSYSDSSDAGATWTLRDDAFPYFLRVNTSAVPEPGCGILILAGLASGIRVRGRHRHVVG